MFVRALLDHKFLAKVALAVVTLIGFLHLFLFFAIEVVDVWRKLGRL